MCKKKSVNLLKSLSQYIKTDEETESFFLNETETRIFAKGEMLSKHRTFNRTVFFMEEGLARSFYFEKGKDITTNFFSEGKIFANIDTIFTGEATRYNIETLEESTITFCQYDKLEELCSNSLTSANFSRFILGNLLTQMVRRVNSMQYMTAKEKYAQLLEDSPNIILRAPLGMIATFLGISQETLSRIRSEI